MATRQELQRRLRQLDAFVPAMIIDYPRPGDFINAFIGEAEKITDDASASDIDWANNQVDAILLKHGFHADPNQGLVDG